MSVLRGDLRLRLLMALLLVAAVSQLATLPAALLAAGAAAALAAALRTGRRLWRRLLHVEAFLGLLLVTLPFTVPGQPLLALGPVTASAEGARVAALLVAKVGASALLARVLLGDVEPVRLGAALRSLGVPEPLVRQFVLTGRYLGVIEAEARRLQEAMRARGFRPRSDRHGWRCYGNLAGMLMVRALERADRVAEAMRCRGHSGRFPWPQPPAPGPAFWGWLGLALAAALGLTAMDRL